MFVLPFRKHVTLGKLWHFSEAEGFEVDGLYGYLFGSVGEDMK